MSQKKKILFLLHFPPPIHGSSLVGAQIKNSKLINESFHCHYINLLLSSTIDASNIGSVEKLLKAINIAFSLIKELVYFRPKLCYFALTATGKAFFKDALYVLLIKIFRVKIIYHLHNKGIINFNENALFNAFYSFVFSNTKVILLSDLLYEDISKYVLKQNTYICYNGLSFIEILDTRKINDPPKIPHLLFLSNLLHSKGVFELIEALKILRQKKIIFRCNIVGNEGDLTYTEVNKKISIHALNVHVSCLGAKYENEKIEIYKDSDIFVFPTLNDCFPLVLLEAMYFSLPIISTREGGIPDIVEDGVTGFLVEKGNAEQLARKLEILIINENLRLSMGFAGRKKYEEKFTTLKFETRLNDIFNNEAHKLCR